MQEVTRSVVGLGAEMRMQVVTMGGSNGSSGDNLEFDDYRITYVRMVLIEVADEEYGGSGLQRVCDNKQRSSNELKWAVTTVPTIGIEHLFASY